MSGLVALFVLPALVAGGDQDDGNNSGDTGATTRAVDADGASLQTTSDNNYGAAIFTTYAGHDDNGKDGNVGCEFTCGGGAATYGIAANTLSVWVR